MASRLTPREREELAVVLAAIRAAGPALDADRATAVEIADLARTALPDIDEVETGRVLFFVAAAVRQLASTGHDPLAMGNVFTLAAIDLTAIAGEDPEPP
jgi:hypothetical protein